MMIFNEKLCGTVRQNFCENFGICSGFFGIFEVHGSVPVDYGIQQALL